MITNCPDLPARIAHLYPSLANVDGDDFPHDDDDDVSDNVSVSDARLTLSEVPTWLSSWHLTPSGQGPAPGQCCQEWKAPTF